MVFPVKQAFTGTLLSLLWFGASTAPALSVGEDYVLTQKSLKMGDQYTYLTPNGVRLTNPRSGTSLVAKSPLWDIELFNDKTHLTGTVKHEKYKHQIAVSGTNEFISGQWERQKAPVTICGLKCTAYKIKGTMVKVLANGARDTNTGIVGGVYIVYDGIKIAPGLADLMTSAYNVPYRDSVPIAMYWEMSDGSHSPRLETYRVDKTTIPPAYFDKPFGYKPASSAELVMLSPDQLEMMEMMAKGGDGAVVDAQNKLNSSSSNGVGTPGQSGIMYNQRDTREMLEKLKQTSK